MVNRFNSMAEVKAANKAIDNHWFEPSTMRFFNSRIESKLYAGRFFITSERRELDLPKRYSIREAMPNGDIKTVGEFQEFLTLEDAKDRAKELSRTIASAQEARARVTG
jgi:hypothetical protein